MKIGVNCGHTLKGAGYGVSGLVEETKWTRIIGYGVMSELMKRQYNVVNCTCDYADTQNKYLAESVKLANDNKVDFFISIHLNACATHLAKGSEVYTHNGKAHTAAVKVLEALHKYGFTNRNVKNGNELYVIRKTAAEAMLIEVCFCDNDGDLEIIRKQGTDKLIKGLAQAIDEGLQEMYRN